MAHAYIYCYLLWPVLAVVVMTGAKKEGTMSIHVGGVVSLKRLLLKVSPVVLSLISNMAMASSLATVQRKRKT